jgi:hypothetical protein
MDAFVTEIDIPVSLSPDITVDELDQTNTQISSKDKNRYYSPEANLEADQREQADAQAY